MKIRRRNGIKMHPILIKAEVQSLSVEGRQDELAREDVAMRGALTKRRREVYAEGMGHARAREKDAATTDAATKSRMEKSVLGMGQITITKDAVAKDAPILSSKEVSASGMEQNTLLRRNAVMKDAPILLKREEAAVDMGQRCIAAMKDAPTKPRREESAKGMGQRLNSTTKLAAKEDAPIMHREGGYVGGTEQRGQFALIQGAPTKSSRGLLVGGMGPRTRNCKKKDQSGSDLGGNDSYMLARPVLINKQIN